MIGNPYQQPKKKKNKKNPLFIALREVGKLNVLRK